MKKIMKYKNITENTLRAKHELVGALNFLRHSIPK